MTQYSTKVMAGTGKKIQPEQESAESKEPVARSPEDELSESAGPDLFLPAPPPIDIANSPGPGTYPADWVYRMLFGMSVFQIMFLAILTPYWVKASRSEWNMYDPTGEESRGWMFLSLSTSLKFVGMLCAAVTAGVGIWIGGIWQKGKQNATLFEPEMTRIQRAAVFIAAYDLPTALLQILYAIYRPISALEGVWLLCKFGICVKIVHGIRSTWLKRGRPTVRGDLEFAINSSMVLIGSMLQILASMLGGWIVLTEFEWSSTREGIAAFCYVSGLFTTMAAGYLDANVSITYLGSNTEAMVAKGLRFAMVINAINLISVGVAGCIRGVKALADTLTITAFLACLMFMQARMHYIAILSTRKDQTAKVVASYVQQAQSNV